MNSIIEQLGGYKKAKIRLDGADKSLNYYQELSEDLLQYRRLHNIFEVGDLVVFKDPNDSLDRNGLGKGTVLRIKEICLMDYLIFAFSKHGFGRDRFKHATDEEIQAGRRL